MDIKKKLKELSLIQNIDNQLNYISILKGELPSELQEIERKANDYEDKIKTLESSIQDAELRIVAEKKATIEKQELLLDSAKQKERVTKSREYDALEKEIELYELDIKISEKRIGKNSELIASAKAEATELNAALDEMKKNRKEKEEELQKLITEKNKEEKDLLVQRQKVLENFDKNLLDRYNRVRKTMNNDLGIVDITKGACGGCFMMVPLQKRVDVAQYEEIQVCDNCGVFFASTTLNEVSEDGYNSTLNPYEEGSMLENVRA